MRADQKVKGERGQEVVRHRTLDEMQACMARARDAVAAGASGRQSVSEKKTFTGTESIDEYIGMLRDGWRDAVTDEVRGLDGLSSDESERLTFVRNVGGAFPLVPAHLSGAPDAMLHVRPEPSDKVRSLTLVMDCSYACDVSQKVVQDYALQVMRLVAWLQAERIDVNVYACIRAGLYSSTVANYLTPVRTAGSVLQPERIAAVLHPSFLRRAFFAMLEHEHHELQLPGAESCRYGYGHPRDPSLRVLQAALPWLESIVVLPKPGRGDPTRAVEEAVNMKFKRAQ